MIKSDLNLRKIESNYEFQKNETNIIMNSNLKSVNNSPIYEQRKIIVNPIPEIVILKPRKKWYLIVDNYFYVFVILDLYINIKNKKW